MKIRALAIGVKQTLDRVADGRFRWSGQWMAAVGVFATAIVLLLAPATSAQRGITLDEAVSAALSAPSSATRCNRLGGPAPSGNYGPNLDELCSTSNLVGSGQGTSGGSVTAGTRQGLLDEERRIWQRLKEKREQEREPRAPGASADTAMRLRGPSLFAAGEFEAFQKDITRFEPGYSSDSAGGTLGADYTFTDWMVAGAAFNYAHIDGNFKRSSGGFQTDSYGGLVFAGFVPARGFFIDAVAGYARKSYSIEREVAFAIGVPAGLGFLTRNGIAVGETSGNQYIAGLNAGYDFIVRNLTIGPRVGLNYKLTSINGFTERGKRASGCVFDNGIGDVVCGPRPATGLELAYDRQEETSLTSVGGMFASLAISTRFGVLIPQTTFEYLHEFEDDQRSIRFRFAEDLNRTKLSFNNDPPDRDYFYASAGLVLILPGGWSPFVNYRTLLGYRDQSSHTVTAGLRFNF